ncbi:hypothetical protein AKJ51_00160 [candidate division MSBL1 archaeon SCGC-AAA382A20]|uniref:Uncharacterized protein n=1 Tax=candidate division MSBL1 archaeon SCGC-AAA382A20 TaxID=1698280 RepID=A0A133VMV7_9EURY|nr:hypothetical protein AKJ51_00160 [candidate division MSBL1 archaeon SCGC-AAA382A20]
MIGVEKMANEEKAINQLDFAQRYIYRRAKVSFEKHSRNCKHQYIGPNEERKCSYSQGKQLCRFESCPLIQKREGRKA